MNKKQSKLFMIISSILIGISVFLFLLPRWIFSITGASSVSQFLSRWSSISFRSKQFLSSTGIYLVVAIGISALIVFIFTHFVKKVNIKRVIKIITSSIVVVSMLTISIVRMIPFFESQNISETLSEEVLEEVEELKEFQPSSYIIPSSDIVKFPNKKKNLILIYLESFESTYFSKKLGGAVDYNLIPNLTKEIGSPTSINFSHNQEFGGTYQAAYTGFSIAGMFATQTGLPFKTPIDGNQYGNVYDFAPGAITLGDILEHEGYNLEFLVGADGEFAGVSDFYKKHGGWNVLDHKEAIAQGKIPSDYNVWWGYEDSKLYDYAKETLENVSTKDEPFAMILETDDTHFPDGYLDAKCPTPYAEPYENAINCTDIMVNDFIDYVKQQEYYKDTIIVIHGDHLSMEKPYFEKNIDPDYERTVFNAYLNVDKNLVHDAEAKNRQMTTMDVFPTILGAMNVEISGNRLGYGTNLFSKIPTLYEEFGIGKPNEEYLRDDEEFIKDIMLDQRKYE